MTSLDIPTPFSPTSGKQFLGSQILKSQRGGVFLAIVILMLTVIGLFLASPKHTLGPLATVLVVDQKPTKANAIVVLLGGESPERIAKAYSLFQAGFSDKIVFGTGFKPKSLKTNQPAFHWISAGERYLTALKSAGVPESSLVLLNTDEAYDTAGELAEIAQYGREEGWATVLLVTSPFHTRRVDLIWDRVASDIPQLTISSPSDGYKTWWKYGQHRRNVAYEYGALLKEAISQITDFFAIGVEMVSDLTKSFSKRSKESNP